MTTAIATDFAACVHQIVEQYENPDVSAADVPCDRHDPESIAFRIVDTDLNVDTLTYGNLKTESERFGNVLLRLGVGPGDRDLTPGVLERIVNCRLPLSPNLLSTGQISLAALKGSALGIQR